MTKNNIIFVGDQYHIKHYPSYKQPGIVFNSDRWKTNVHKAFTAPPGVRGAISLFAATSRDEQRLLRQFSRHLAAERAMQKNVPGRGVVIVFANETGRACHFLDAQSMCLVGGHKAGVRVIDESKAITIHAGVKPSVVGMPGGRSYIR